MTHSGGLAAGESYNANLTAALPAVPPGYSSVVVQADSTYQEPVTNRGNLTLAASTGQLQVSLPALAPGTPVSGSFTAADEDQYNVLFSTPDDPTTYTQAGGILAVAPSGPAGILRAGQTRQLSINILSTATISGDQIPIRVG